MTEMGTNRFVKSSKNSDRVLVPQPSEDPQDPLNWNRFWKMNAMTIATATSFSQSLSPLALAPMFPQMMESFDSDLASVVQFTGVCILVLGFSNFFWYAVPFALRAQATNRRDMQDPHPNVLRPSPGADLLDAHLPCQQHLASTGHFVQ